MAELPRSTGLLRRVASRMRAASFGLRLYVAFLAVCALYFTALLASRLLGLLPGWFESVTLFSFSAMGRSLSVVAPTATFLVLPAAALLLAGLWLAFRWRVASSQAARLVDRHGGTKDLFLTVSRLEESLGEYRPLVAEAAEAKASAIRPAAVVPFRWQRRLGRALAAAAVLALAFNLPQLDPFGKVASARSEEQAQQELAKTRRASQIRLAQLTEKPPSSEESPEIERSVERLKQEFQKAKPEQTQENLQRLTARQRELGKKYQEIRREKLKELLSKSASSRFRRDEETLQKWTRELQEGSTESLRKEIAQLKDQLQRLTKTDDPVEKAELRQKIREKLQDMERLASEQAGSKELSAALKRAQRQLELSKSEGLSEGQAAEGMAESLDLAKLELEEIAQSARDLKKLEEALKTLQMAKRINDLEKLDGRTCKNFKGLGDYEKLYKKMMAEAGAQRKGRVGMRGPGTGAGGEAPEDDSSETEFAPKQSKAQVTAGKVLLSLKNKGVSESGEATMDYREAVREVRQGVSEAIRQEQVPPGYHEGIKRYFDTIEPPTPDSPDDAQK